jgi:hypothetical protein
MHCSVAENADSQARKSHTSVHADSAEDALLVAACEEGVETQKYERC